MNILSVICILILVPYLLIALSFMPKGEGRRLFRMIYSAVTFGAMSFIFYFMFESMVTEYQAYITPDENVLRKAFAFLMLLIPFNILMISLNLCLKKKRTGLMFAISCAVSALVSAAVPIYCYMTDGDYTYSYIAVLQFLIVFVPMLLSFIVGGFLGTEKKYERVLHNISLYLELAALIAYLALTAWLNFSDFVAIGVSGILTFLPLVIVWVAIPVIPICVYSHFRNKDAIRNGEAPKGKLRLRSFKKKKEDK